MVRSSYLHKWISYTGRKTCLYIVCRGGEGKREEGERGGDRQTNRDRRTDRQTDRHRHRQTDTDRQTDRQTERDREMDRERQTGMGLISRYIAPRSKDNTQGTRDQCLHTEIHSLAPGRCGSKFKPLIFEHIQIHMMVSCNEFHINGLVLDCSVSSVLAMEVTCPR